MRCSRSSSGPCSRSTCVHISRTGPRRARSCRQLLETLNEPDDSLGAGARAHRAGEAAARADVARHDPSHRGRREHAAAHRRSSQHAPGRALGDLHPDPRGGLAPCVARGLAADRVADRAVPSSPRRNLQPAARAVEGPETDVASVALGAARHLRRSPRDRDPDRRAEAEASPGLTRGRPPGTLAAAAGRGVPRADRRQGSGSPPLGRDAARAVPGRRLARRNAGDAHRRSGRACPQGRDPVARQDRRRVGDRAAAAAAARSRAVRPRARRARARRARSHRRRAGDRGAARRLRLVGAQPPRSSRSRRSDPRSGRC